jgi:hypothetical protein
MPLEVAGVAPAPVGVPLTLVNVALGPAAGIFEPAGVGLGDIGETAGVGIGGIAEPAGVALGGMGETFGVTVGVAEGVISGAVASIGPGDSNGGEKPNNCCNSGSAS